MSTRRAPPTPRSKPPLVAIVGTTGVGKTDLGVELAKALSARTVAPTRAEVLNHDSMQCYRGLDVITNKATAEEMRGVDHHLMGFLDPGSEWGVNDFLRDALAKVRRALCLVSLPCARLTGHHVQIDELEQRETLPISVGGTSYYLQNLVFPGQLVNDVPSRPSSPTADLLPSATPPSSPPPAAEPRTLDDIAHFPPSLRSSITSLPPELLSLFLSFPLLPQLSSPSSLPPSFPLALLPPRLRSPDTLAPALFALLRHVDPRSAERWHWRDVRKVGRAVEILWTGRRWEDVREAQRARPPEGAR